MAIEQIWFGTRAVRFENGGNTGAQLEQVNSEADFATRLVGGQSVDNTGAEWQQMLAFRGAEGHGANLANGVDAADLRVGNGVTAHNLADIAGNGRVIDLTGTLDEADDTVVLTGHGRQSAGALGAATTEATGSANRVVFSNDLGFGLINGSGTDTGGTANASRLNDGDSVNVEVRQGRVLGEASFTVKVRDGGSAAVVLDSDGRTVRDTNGSLQGGFVQDASAGELDLGLVAHGTRITVDYDARTISIGGAAFTGDATAFFDAFEAGGAKDLTLGSRLGSQNGWSADDLVLTTGELEPEPEVAIAATFGGVASGKVQEDATLAATGALTVSHPGAGKAGFVAQSDSAGAYGSFSIGADGGWSYKLGNGHAAVQALKGGEGVTDSFIVASLDGSTTTVVIAIAGSDDAATFGGRRTGAVFEDDTLATGGTLTVHDADAGQAALVPQSAMAGVYGSFSIGADGAWSYLLDNGAAHVQALVAGESHEERFTVESVDGSTTTVTVEVRGRNDLAVFGGTSSGSVREDTTLTAAGTLTVADPDAGQAGFTAQSGSAGAYGTFSIDAGGAWSYLLSNAATGVQALTSGQTMQEHFIVTSLDGSTTQVTISLQGLDETFLPTPFTGTGDPNDDPARPAAPAGKYTTYGSGGDSVRGSSSGDWIDGGDGNDTIMAGNGSDAIRGGAGNDRINVAGGNDWADGGVGADSVAGGGGNDILIGGDGADTVSGGNGAATIYGDAGNDSLNGNPLLYGGEGNDSLVGGASAGDTIHGGSGADTIRGRGGDDLIVGGYGADTITAGDGADRIAFLSARDTGDLITDWGSSDVLDFSAFAGTLAFKAAAGQSFTAQNQVAWYQDAGDTYVVVDTDGMLDTAEFAVRLEGLHSITAADLVL